MTTKEKLKKIRPFIGILFFILLFLISSILVFFSQAAAFILPLFWMLFTLMHQLYQDSVKITYLWNASRFSMWVYFLSILILFVWTPDWVKFLSTQLEKRSFFSLFKEGNYMAGRLSVAFILAVAVLVVFLFVYRKNKSKH